MYIQACQLQYCCHSTEGTITPHTQYKKLPSHFSNVLIMNHHWTHSNHMYIQACQLQYCCHNTEGTITPHTQYKKLPSHFSNVLIMNHHCYLVSDRRNHAVSRDACRILFTLGGGGGGGHAPDPEYQKICVPTWGLRGCSTMKFHIL